MQVFRDWRYITPLLGLAAITMIGAVLAGSSSGGAAAVVAPTATAPATEAVPSPAPTSSPTPDLGAVLLDSRRKLDLAGLRDALETYRARFRAYPTTNSAFQAACASPSDALCALNGVAAKLSFTDGKRPYEYRSDGASFTLYTEIQVEPAAGGCFGDVPADLAGLHVFCVSSQGGGQ